MRSDCMKAKEAHHCVRRTSHLEHEVVRIVDLRCRDLQLIRIRMLVTHLPFGSPRQPVALLDAHPQHEVPCAPSCLQRRHAVMPRRWPSPHREVPPDRFSVLSLGITQSGVHLTTSLFLVIMQADEGVTPGMREGRVCAMAVPTGCWRDACFVRCSWTLHTEQGCWGLRSASQPLRGREKTFGGSHVFLGTTGPMESVTLNRQ